MTAPVCEHGVRLSCGEVHDEDDPRLGEPICPDCFDYERAVIWNALAPELWRRTAIQIPRELARLVGVSQRRLRKRVRVSYVKVAEYQRRGSLHFHVVVRLDAAQPKDRAELVEPPPAEFTSELLAEAVRACGRACACPCPPAARWPAGERRACAVGSPGRRARPRPVAGGRRRVCGVHRQVRDQEHRAGGRPDASAVGERRREPAGAAARAADGAVCVGSRDASRDLRRLRLRRWAHALGFRGHCFTKSRRYSTTFTRCGGRGTSTSWSGCIGAGGVIRGAGRGATARRSSTSATRSRAPATGRSGTRGWPRAGAARARERRRVAREELRRRSLWPAGRRRERIRGREALVSRTIEQGAVPDGAAGRQAARGCVAAGAARVPAGSDPGPADARTARSGSGGARSSSRGTVAGSSRSRMTRHEGAARSRRWRCSRRGRR